MPESFFILSKDRLEMAADEITSIAKIYDRFSKAKLIDNMIIIQSKTHWEKIARRATFAKESGQIGRAHV